MARGTGALIPPRGPQTAPEDACVARVKVVVAAEAPGVRLAGEKEAVHLPGNPVQAKLTGVSIDPPCGVSRIVVLADRPRVTLTFAGFASNVKMS